MEPAPWCHDAWFVLTTIGDGEATTLHRGWIAICDAVVGVHYHEPDAEQRKEMMTWFLDWEEWSNAPDGFPWRWEKHHEDGAVYVWRITDAAALAAERAEAYEQAAQQAERWDYIVYSNPCKNIAAGIRALSNTTAQTEGGE